jgi:hypothetical protein
MPCGLLLVNFFTYFTYPVVADWNSLSFSELFKIVEDCPKTRLVNKIETIADIIIIVNNAILKKYFFLVFCKPMTNNILQ